ncbi:MAG TPA: hypothetical protein VK601_21175, partial [Kofleriaceae bacterium]|nr:hypothetical protein [Kofleriaceae bacterium]
MTALRTCVALGALSLAACDNLLGLHDIEPDGAPVALALTVAGNGVAQQPLAPIAVTVLDVRGMPVANYASMVTLTLGNRAGGGSLIGTLTAPVTDGRASFDLVGIDRPGAGYTLVASSGTLPLVTSGSIAITAPRFAPVATGILGGPITSVAVSPGPPGGPATVFAGANDGVYKSVDGGASWKLANFGGEGSGRLVADRDHPGVVYLQRDFGSLTIKRTADGGATWHDLAPAPSSAFIATFAVDPRNSSVIYAAGPKFLRSDDGGATWTTVGAQVNCNRIAVDPIAPDTVYCVAYDSNTQASAVYKTSNAGATWGPINGLPSSNSIDIVVATRTGVFVTAGSVLYRSIDGGASWTNVCPSSYALADAPSRPDRIYVVTPGGIAVSNDGGASFGPSVDVGDPIHGLAVDPTHPDVVYAAGASVGVLVSTNGGASWAVSSKGIDVHPIGSVAIAPAAPGTAVLTTGTTVLRTIDGGASWTTISQVNAMVSFDPAVSTRAYLCGPGYFATSINSGASFTGGLTPSLDSGCGRLVAAGGKLYTAASGRVYRSDDGGASWAKVGLSSELYANDVALGDATGDG